MTSILERAPSVGVDHLVDEVQIAEVRRAPLDPLTGQPYLILPVELPGDQRDTYHHLWYYRKHPDLGSGRWPDKPETAKYNQIAGLSVRMSSGEYLMRSTHEQVHARFPGGPELANDLTDKFRIAVSGAVGIVPRKLIDITQPIGQELIDVDEQTFAEVAGAQNTGIEHFRKPRVKNEAVHILGSFFLRYAIRQDLSQLDHRLLERMLQAKQPNVKRDVAAEILDGALQIALQPLKARLEEHRQQGFVQPGRQDALTELRALIPKPSYEHEIPYVRVCAKLARTAQQRQAAAKRTEAA